MHDFGSVLLIVPKLELSPFASDLVGLRFHVFTGIPCTFINAIFFSNVGKMQALWWPWPHSFLTCWAPSELQQLHLDFLIVTFVQRIFLISFLSSCYIVQCLSNPLSCHRKDLHWRAQRKVWRPARLSQLICWWHHFEGWPLGSDKSRCCSIFMFWIKLQFFL